MSTSQLPTTEIIAQPVVVADEKAIIFDPETRDFAMYLDGELVGFARTYREAEETLDALVYEILVMAYGPPASR